MICSKNHVSCRKYIKQWWVFWYAVDKPKERVEQYRQRECLNGAVSKDKSLGDKKKKNIEHIKGSVKIAIELSKKAYAKYNQRKLYEKWISQVIQPSEIKWPT